MVIETYWSLFHFEQPSGVQSSDVTIGPADPALQGALKQGAQFQPSGMKFNGKKASNLPTSPVLATAKKILMGQRSCRGSGETKKWPKQKLKAF